MNNQIFKKRLGDKSSCRQAKDGHTNKTHKKLYTISKALLN